MPSNPPTRQIRVTRQLITREAILRGERTASRIFGEAIEEALAAQAEAAAGDDKPFGILILSPAAVSEADEDWVRQCWQIHSADDLDALAMHLDRPRSAEMNVLRGALQMIAGPAGDADPWIEVYRNAGGGYDGLQAVASAALDMARRFGLP